MPGTRIKKRRELLGLTQEDMSLQLHMSQSAYSRIENKESTLRIDTARKIALILGCTLSDLLPDDCMLNNEMDNNPFQTPSSEELTAIVNSVVDEKINHLKLWMQQHLSFASKEYV
jgi:transcriptional regulator with XRE-family HTH domain